MTPPKTARTERDPCNYSSSGIHVRHYALTATRETLQVRLRLRLRGGGRVLRQLLGRDETWAIQQIERCVTALSGERYATHVPTDEQTTDEIVEAIAADAGLALSRPRLSPVRERIQRLQLGVRHIRL